MEICEEVKALSTENIKKAIEICYIGWKDTTITEACKHCPVNELCERVPELGSQLLKELTERVPE